jgi:hypothetical protein
MFELLLVRLTIRELRCVWLHIRLRILRLRKDALLGEIKEGGGGDVSKYSVFKPFSI